MTQTQAVQNGFNMQTTQEAIERPLPVAKEAIAGVRIFRSTLSPMSATVVAVDKKEKPLFVVETDISFAVAEQIVACFKVEYDLAD